MPAGGHTGKPGGRTGAGSRSVHLQVLLRMGCPLIPGTIGTHAMLTHPLRSGPFPGPLSGQALRHFAPLSSRVLEFGNIAKMPLSSHIWRLLQRKCWFGGRLFPSSRVGSLAFLVGGCCIVGQSDPAQVTVPERKPCCLPAPGWETWPGREGGGQRVPTFKGSKMAASGHWRPF